MRGSDWHSFRRCLAIIQRLRKGPATSVELVEYVCAREGPFAYPASSSAREKALKRDRESIRRRLHVKLGYARSTQRYSLLDVGDYLTYELSDVSLHALSLLKESFSGQVGEHSDIQVFMDELIFNLPAEGRRQLESPVLPINLELFQQIDSNGISPVVWEIVQRSVKEHHKLAFNYISPQYTDQKKRMHEVVPYRIQYQWGHWYLRAYRLLRRDIDGSEDRQGVHLRYRLSYIQNDEDLALLPAITTGPPPLPRYKVHYRLLPPLSRGLVSRHFDDMYFETLEDGSLEIFGTCDNEWEAGRLLMAYGEYCIVLGGPEVRAWVHRTVSGIKKNYPD